MKTFGIACVALLFGSVLTSACTQDFEAFQFAEGGAAGMATSAGTGGKSSTGGNKGSGGQSKTGGAAGL
ncbi:MAG: hypothetical protein SFV15_15630 [Polyangiaceae bacterium]|nr:hypothetical protein [Polyangiaceae bacterium]